MSKTPKHEYMRQYFRTEDLLSKQAADREKMMEQKRQEAAKREMEG
jgi:hypothetical protein